MIIITGTPIGNLLDVSTRLRETLSNAKLIAAEDTRKTKQLMRLLEIDNKPEIISLNDHNEKQKAAELIDRAKNEDIVLVSDAGMPTVSDPGYNLVRLAHQEGIQVTTVPGPSAVTTALAVSGLPSDSFVFEGFFPRKHSQQEESAKEILTRNKTTIFFESALRLADTLSVLKNVLSQDREVVVCRELTKMYEEVKRGSASELHEWAVAGVKGEIVLLIGPAKQQKLSADDLVEELKQELDSGKRLKDVSRELAKSTGVSAKQIYDKALEIRGKND